MDLEKRRATQREISASPTSTREELSNLSKANNPQPISDDPITISEGIRAAVETYQRITNVQGLKDAIARLEIGVQERQKQVAGIERQLELQQKRKRLEEGRNRFRAKIKEVEKFLRYCKHSLDLKSIALEYEQDFKAVNSNSSNTLEY